VIPRALPCAALVLLAACTVGPNYHRPSVNVPPDYRNQQPSTTPATTLPLGEEKWTAVFPDPELQNLIRKGLANGYDVRIAATRILQAQAQVGITRSQQFPNVNGSVGFTAEKLPGFAFNVIQLEGLFSWTPDFWGMYRRATEAARANLLATEWAQKEVASTLVSNIAMAYFTLRELDLELQIAQQTLSSRQESLKLTQTLADHGAVSLLDVRQAQQLVESAAETIPATERSISQQEDLLSTLIGDNPHDIPRGMKLTDQPLPPAIPAGLPSQLLERRPDIRQAEQQLVSANAEIGVARAQFFPSLPLTGAAGVESANLGGLFKSGSAAWNFSAPITQPIFNAGRLRNNLKQVQAVEQQMLLTYEQTIQQAFRQVSDALIAYQKDREFREHQQLLTNAAQSAANLSEMRYRAGATSYLEVLTSETNYFTAELNLARAQLNERLALAQLYYALGGGWEQ
jgi:multidrug efflux system outer membrane protein